MSQPTGALDGRELSISIVASRFNGLITDRLLEGAVDVLRRHGVSGDRLSITRVPGSFEIPFAIASLIKNGAAGDGVIAIGAVLRGETSHYEVIVNEVSRGIGQLNLQSDVPVTFGVITADTADQALERSGGAVGNKGAEAALACLEMAHLARRLKSAKPVKSP